MAYTISQLEKLTPEELAAIAAEFNIKTRNTDRQSLIYTILDNEADRHAEDVQAKVDAREENNEKKRRTRIQPKVERVSLSRISKGRQAIGGEDEAEAIASVKRRYGTSAIRQLAVRIIPAPTTTTIHAFSISSFRALHEVRALRCYNR